MTKFAAALASAVVVLILGASVVGAGPAAAESAPAGRSAVVATAVVATAGAATGAAVGPQAESQVRPTDSGDLNALPHLAEAVFTTRTDAPDPAGIFRAIWARCIMLLIPDETRRTELVAV